MPLSIIYHPLSICLLSKEPISKAAPSNTLATNPLLSAPSSSKFSKSKAKNSLSCAYIQVFCAMAMR